MKNLFKFVLITTLAIGSISIYADLPHSHNYYLLDEQFQAQSKSHSIMIGSETKECSYTRELIYEILKCSDADCNKNYHSKHMFETHINGCPDQDKLFY